jgi:hypothetical protein
LDQHIPTSNSIKGEQDEKADDHFIRDDPADVRSRPSSIRGATTGYRKSGTSMKAVSITGTISDDGEMFVSDKDGKSWTISNPDTVKGHEGHHVILQAQVDADKSQVHVMSLKMAKGSM